MSDRNLSRIDRHGLRSLTLAPCDLYECPIVVQPIQLAACFARSRRLIRSCPEARLHTALGQASNLSAIAAIRNEQTVQTIDVPALQNKLRAQAAVLELKGMAAIPPSSKLPGVVVDDEQAEYTGDWST